jgi:hypothetical protein
MNKQNLEDLKDVEILLDASIRHINRMEQPLTRLRLSSIYEHINDAMTELDRELMSMREKYDRDEEGGGRRKRKDDE